MKKKTFGLVLVLAAFPFMTTLARAGVVGDTTDAIKKFIPHPQLHVVMVPEDALDHPELQKTTLKSALNTWARPGDTVIYKLEPGSHYKFMPLTLDSHLLKWTLEKLPLDGLSASLKLKDSVTEGTLNDPVNVTLHLVNKDTGKAVSFDPLVPTLPGGIN